jgi:protein transport protein SEC31
VVDDTERRLNGLFDAMNNTDIAKDLLERLMMISKSLEARDYDGAQRIHMDLMTTKMTECGQWLIAIKRLTELARACQA